MPERRIQDRRLQPLGHSSTFSSYLLPSFGGVLPGGKMSAADPITNPYHSRRFMYWSFSFH